MKLQMLMFINISVAYNDEMELIVWMSYGLETLIYLLTFLIVPFSHFISSAAHVGAITKHITNCSIEDSHV